MGKYKRFFTGLLIASLLLNYYQFNKYMDVQDKADEFLKYTHYLITWELEDIFKEYKDYIVYDIDLSKEENMKKFDDLEYRVDHYNRVLCEMDSLNEHFTGIDLNSLDDYLYTMLNDMKDRDKKEFSQEEKASLNAIFSTYMSHGLSSFYTPEYFKAMKRPKSQYYVPFQRIEEISDSMLESY